MNLPTTRLAAAQAGSKRYFTGKPCPYGHVVSRFTVSHACSACARIRADAWNKAHPKEVAASSKRTWHRNADKYRARKRRYTVENKRKVIVGLARYRARKKGVEFSITEHSLDWPTHCPVLGIELDYARERIHQENSPTIDRIVGELGYVPGNVRVISFRANRIKANATAAELRLVADYVEREIARRCGV